MYLVEIFCTFLNSSRSKVKGHLQLYVAFVNDGVEENNSNEHLDEQGWEVLSIDNSAGHEEQPAQVS